METRIVTQVKLYKLVMNGIRQKFEDTHIVAVSTDHHKLVDWYKSFKCDQHEEKIFEDEHPYRINFLKDSPLYWYNPVMDIDTANDGGPYYSGQTGIFTEWVMEDRLPEIKGRFTFID